MIKERPHLPVDVKAEYELRQRIICAARYHPRLPHDYSVIWLGRRYFSNNTTDLVDKVIAALAKEYINE